MMDLMFGMRDRAGRRAAQGAEGAASETRENAAFGPEEAPRQAGAVVHVEEADHGKRYTRGTRFRQGIGGLAVVMLMQGGAMAETMQRGSHKGYEMPPYRVEATEGAYELRDYGPYVVAEVQVSGSRDRAIGQGFRALAGYIFGGNAEGEKVSMTVPVAQSPDGGGDWTVSFMMPARFTLATLPAPKDGRIRLVEHAAERVAVVTFSGLRGDGVLATRERALREWVAGRGLTVAAGPHYWFYDGPMTLPWNRRNEVALTVR